MKIWIVRSVFCGICSLNVFAIENVRLTDVPDYSWYGGCFGTAGGNLMGFWDRHGFPDFYTGPTNSGLAPLDSDGINSGVRSMWASRAGMDGRPADEPGHIDDYWVFYQDETALSYESTEVDPYVAAGRTEHKPDCIGDFIGASQNKWKNLDGEHDGNIDAYAVTFWDKFGAKRSNFQPSPQGEFEVRDLPSGLRTWSSVRGYESNVYSQLVDFFPGLAPKMGFSFEAIKAEIDAGYPVMLYLQNHDEKIRSLPGMERANPNVHGMLAYGYVVLDSGEQIVRYKTSWGGSGDNSLRLWSTDIWEALLQLKGVIGFHPLPKIKSVRRSGNTLNVKWHGPSSEWQNLVTGEIKKVHRYVLEKSPTVDSKDFVPLSDPTTNLEADVPNCCEQNEFFRVRLLENKP
ncbi:MAG: hypothetical protein O2960_19080 [Verrucomicrobia bacterium]|nr:hypothetical protein [Verrucomicrobiota bacterium]